jgi:hypothetical protein
MVQNDEKTALRGNEAGSGEGREIISSQTRRTWRAGDKGEQASQKTCILFFKLEKNLVDSREQMRTTKGC